MGAVQVPPCVQVLVRVEQLGWSVSVQAKVQVLQHAPPGGQGAEVQVVLSP